jgi:hypothetical protein
MILVISDAADVHTRLVMQRLRELGAPCLRYSAHELPHKSRISTHLSNDRAARILIQRELGDFDLDAVRTVWCRRLGDPWADPEMSKEDREFSSGEARSMLFGLSTMLADRFWINPFVVAYANDRGNGKLAQLEVAREVGLTIPRTLATNDPATARAFLTGLDDGAIYKPFNPPTRNVGELGEPPRWATVYTNKLDEAALARLDGVAAAPCIFQELLAKRVELRVIAIGDRVFATEIHSQVSEASAIDFRRNYALGETPYAAHELPAEVSERCLALNRRLGLVFGAMDFVLTPDGRYVFLEVNQQGQFLWLEQMTGQPLLEHFCEMLKQGRPDYTCDARAHAPGLPPLLPIDPKEAAADLR